MARFSSSPPLRCSLHDPISPTLFCGNQAAYLRRLPHTGAIAFVCERCHAPSDEPVVDPLNIRRIAVTCEVYFSGVTTETSAAQGEAVARLEAAIAAAGGVLNVNRVTSSLARYYPSVAAVGGRRESDRG